MIISLFRSRLIWIFAIALPMQASAGTPLPSSCTSKYASVYGEAWTDVFGDTNDYDTDSDSGTDITTPYGGLYRFADITLNTALYRTNGEGFTYTAMAASIQRSTSPIYGDIAGGTSVTTWAWAQHLGGTGTRVYQNAIGDTWGNYLIEENQTYPTEGYETGSAVLTANFYFTTELTLTDTYGNGLYVDMHAECDDSYIDIYPLDSTGSMWASEGLLARLGDDPIEVGESKYANYPFGYWATRATEIGDTVFMRAQLYYQSDWIANALHVEAGEGANGISSNVSYYVEVP